MSVMISLHCASMQASAELLAQELKSRGIEVWFCGMMVGGLNYRTEIVHHIKNCKIFLPLINDFWAKSGECEDEYCLAKRLNLTSHESGRTQRHKDKRHPIIVPVSFSDLNWYEHAHVELLASTTNFVVHNSENLLLGSTRKTIDLILASLQQHGLNLSNMISESTTQSESKENSNHHIGSKSNIPDSKCSKSDSKESKDLNCSTSLTPSLGRVYVAIVEGNGEKNGFKFSYADEERLELSLDASSGECNAVLTQTELRKTVEDYESSSLLPVDCPLKKWASSLGSNRIECSGTWDASKNLLTLFDSETSGHKTNRRVREFSVDDNLLVGETKLIDARNNNRAEVKVTFQRIL